jgi:hypothetical protein
MTGTFAMEFIVEPFPPLTAEQKIKLAGLLAPMRSPVARDVAKLTSKPPAKQ